MKAPVAAALPPQGPPTLRPAAAGVSSRQAIDAIRTLTMDAVERAGCGHPGLPLAMAPVAYTLYARVMRHDPAAPTWPDRDRFVLSAGHGSLLLYAALHLAGYDVSLADLERFRSWGSATPGHPERDLARGIETTTGPLGQGFGNGVGMALAERFLRERYGADVSDHRVFALCSDGDLMEGVAAEAASLAGHLGLGRLVYVYDDNAITIDGTTALSFSEDVRTRFAAYGWQVLSVDDANDLDALARAFAEGCAELERPTLIRVRSTIAYPAPNKGGTSAAHGAALGADEVRATKELLGCDPDAEFAVPDGAYEAFTEARARGAAAHAEWRERFERWSERHPELAAEWQRARAGRPEPGLADVLPRFDPRETEAIATRAASGKAMAAFAAFVPTMVGGSADLRESLKTGFPGEAEFTRERAGRNVNFGVREHAMAAAVNGLALHGGIVRPFGSTFLVFADYMRPAIRLAALMGLPAVWVFSHDSLGVGEDGPTHQPVEQLAALRAIPGLTVLRPADAAEAVEAWRVVLEDLDGPACLVLSRQSLPVLDRRTLAAVSGVQRGAYVLADGHRPDGVLVASGSEVAVALAARELLAERGIVARVVSMPSHELFAAQPAGYRRAVLPSALPKVSVEAGVAQGWERWVDDSVSVERFGASAPGDEVMARLGITPEVAAAKLRTLL